MNSMTCLTRGFSFFLMPLAVLILLSATVSQAQDAVDIQSKIRDIDEQAGELAEKRRRVRVGLDDAVQLSKEARAWFIRLQQVETKIQAMQSENQATFDARNQDDMLKKLYRERESIMQLDGGAIISGTRYTSIDDLRRAFKQGSRLAIDLNKEYQKYSDDLKALDDKRDKLVSIPSTNSKTSIASDEYEIEMLKETREILQMLVDSRDIMCMGDDGIQYLQQGMAVEFVTERYMSYLDVAGGKFQPEVLAARIKEFRDNSDRIKIYLNRERIPELTREIDLKTAALQEKKKNVRSVEDLAGCWLILLPSGKYPSIKVVKQGDNTYIGTIVTLGNLDYFSKGQQLFTVQRTSDSTFSGTENSYSETGNSVRRGVRITIHKGGTGLTYRSDDTVQMRRCQ